MRDFLFGTQGFEPWTPGSLVLHSTTVPQQLLVFTCDNFRYLTLVQRDWWWYCSDWTCERFSFWNTGVWTLDPWISSPALYHCATATSGFHLWQFQVFNSGDRGIGGGFVLNGPVRDFLFGYTRVWTQNLWISNPALYHCPTATFGFNLWQFQVINSGTEGLVVVLFWLDLWEIFILANMGFDAGTSVSLVLHSTTVPWQLLVIISGNFRYLTLVTKGLVVVLFWMDLWEIFFLATLGFETWDLWISSPALYHFATATSGFYLWQFQVFNSGADGLVLVLFWLDLWEIFFLATLGFEPGTSGSLVLHSTTVPWQLLVFTSDNFRYLTLVQRDWWWYCSDWTCESFSFWT